MRQFRFVIASVVVAACQSASPTAAPTVAETTSIQPTAGGVTTGRATVVPPTISLAPSADASLSSTTPQESSTASNSPLGSIVFSLEWVNSNDAASLFRVSSDGSGLTQLTERPEAYARYETGGWFPDGSRVLATLENDTQNPILAIDPVTGGASPIDTGSVLAVDPVVSPDGSHVLFRGGTQADPQSAIYVVNPDGTDLTELTHPLKGGYEGDVGPDYSPDGSQIVFVRDGAIEVANSDGSGIRELLPATTKAWRPRWSPDGRRIVFGIEANAGVSPNVWLINVDGTGITKLVTCPCFADTPSWSPDGGLILFTLRHAGGGGFASIQTMRPDGSGQAVIWAPDEYDVPFQRGVAAGIWRLMSRGFLVRGRLARGQSPDRVDVVGRDPGELIIGGNAARA